MKKIISSAVVFLLIVSCGKDLPQSTFDTYGPIAEEQAFLFSIILWAGLIVLVAVELAIIYIFFRYRRKPDSDRKPSQTHGNTKLEIMWTIIPVIFLAVVLLFYYFSTLFPGKWLSK